MLNDAEVPLFRRGEPAQYRIMEEHLSGEAMDEVLQQGAALLMAWSILSSRFRKTKLSLDWLGIFFPRYMYGYLPC